MSNDSSSNSLAGFFLILGLPVCVVGLVALMVSISIGHNREDPGPGQPEEEAAPEALTLETAPEGIDQAVWDMGKASFATCAACHGTDGMGVMAGPVPMAPSLVGSETLLGEPDRPILVILKGILKETADYAGVMVTLGALSDDQIAAVLTYVRNNWGNSAEPISTDQVAAARTRFADVNAPAGVKRAEIDAILEAHK